MVRGKVQRLILPKKERKFTTIMNIWKVIILVILVSFLGWGIYNLEKEKQGLQEEYAKLKEVTDKLKAENDETKSEIEYYKNQENLLKASREQFNLKKEGETMMIIVPMVSSSSQPQ